MADVTRLDPLPVDWDTALAVVARPNDPEYGPASARCTAQGKKVGYLLVTRGKVGISGLSPEETGPLRDYPDLGRIK